MNPRFEEHEGKLFRMLDEPDAINEFSKTPCVIACKYGDLKKYYILDSPTSNPSMSMLAEGFEIIGYPVADGSKDWALYQMMQGLKVCNPQLAKSKAARLGCDDEIFNTYWYVVGDAVAEGEANYGALSVSSWIAAAASTGWQIYKEPEPAKEPIADCDNCKHACTKSKRLLRQMVIDHCHMYEPKPTFKVGDWVEWCGFQYRVESAPPQSGDRFNICSPYEELGISILPENITRKLSPSEVVIQIGCLRGTVERAPYIQNGFNLVSEAGNCFILFNALDKETLELVGSLLKAQEEE